MHATVELVACRVRLSSAQQQQGGLVITKKEKKDKTIRCGVHARGGRIPRLAATRRSSLCSHAILLYPGPYDGPSCLVSLSTCTDFHPGHLSSPKRSVDLTRPPDPTANRARDPSPPPPLYKIPAPPPRRIRPLVTSSRQLLLPPPSPPAPALGFW
jgi:hypothetical protein